MHHCRALSVLFILLSLAADLAVGQTYRKRDVSTTSIHDATTTQATTSIPMPTASSSTDSAAFSPTTSMIDIHTDISNPQPTLEPSPANTLNGTVSGDGLPIQPKITPAMGVTGVALIISGLAYTLIGIKNQWLHVFLSAAFLTSLSVTVLIEYVMTPPVSNAVQGAYFVAAFFTGVIFGALSLIFKELTEGLGCLLGGFCLSMWLLSVKQGSLLSSSDTRGAFIGAFCIAFYALSFSHYTRPYALIASTAFAGSTAAVLGIDCFSRAGWKEFWLYIWGLNDNLFPTDTSTYPVTRGIRVELAVTVVICLLGLLSQFRLWKLIRERRKKQEQILAEERRKKDEAELELGRALEEKKETDLVRWEAMYGDSSKGDSTAVQTPVSETHEHSMKKLIEAPDNSVEMADLPASTEDTVTGEDDEERHDDEEIEDAAENKLPEAEDAAEAEAEVEADVDEPTTANDDSKETDKESGSPEITQPPPRVTPLPFKVPHVENQINDDDDHSIQAIIDDADTASVRTSKRLSAASIFRRLSHRTNARRSRLRSDSDEMLVPTSPVLSAASSQGIADSEAGSILEESQSIKMDHLHSEPTEDQETVLAEDTVQNDSPNTSSGLETKDDMPAQDTNQSENKTENTPAEDKTPEAEKVEDLEIVSNKRRHTIDGTSPIKALSLAPVTSPPSKTTETTEKEAEKPAPLSSSKSKSSARAKQKEKENLTSEVVKKLPSHVSPVVMSYRTNEWAKHLSHADAPEPEPLAEPVEDTEHAISPEDMEIAAPLNIEELKQTALTATPPPAEKQTSVSESASRATVQRSASILSKQSAAQLVGDQLTTPPLNPTPEIVAPTSPLLLSPSRSQTSAAPGALRSVSSPYLSTAAVSPKKTEARHSVGQVMEEESFSLMAQREKMLQARLSSVSLTQDSWAPRNRSRQSMVSTVEEGQPSRPGSQLSVVEDDDMPLTQRRALLQQKTISPPLGIDTEPRRSPIDARYSTTPRLSREPSKPKTPTMAAWRESLQEDMTKHKPLLEVDLAQTELMEQQRRAQVARSQRIIASENLHNSIAERMRHGNMQDLHREAMRRMQAAANRRTNDSPS